MVGRNTCFESSSALSEADESAIAPEGAKEPSERQIAANRANAQKSTGPRSAEGKARSSMNAVRHGVCAAMALLPGEDVNAFFSFSDAIFDSIRPQDQAEGVLVDQYVSISWKLRRLGDVEEELNEVKVESLFPSFREPGRQPKPKTAAQMLAHELRNEGKGPMLRVMALQDQLQRQLARILKQIKELRALRKTMQEDAEADDPYQPRSASQRVEVIPFRSEGPDRVQLEEDREEKERAAQALIDKARRLAKQQAKEAAAVAAKAQNEPNLPAVAIEDAKPEVPAITANAVLEAIPRSTGFVQNEPNQALDSGIDKKNLEAVN